MEAVLDKLAYNNISTDPKTGLQKVFNVTVVDDTSTALQLQQNLPSQLNRQMTTRLLI